MWAAFRRTISNHVRPSEEGPDAPSTSSDLALSDGLPSDYERPVIMPLKQHDLRGKYDPNQVYASDRHPLTRTRTRKFDELPPLESAPVVPMHKWDLTEAPQGAGDAPDINATTADEPGVVGAHVHVIPHPQSTALVGIRIVSPSASGSTPMAAAGQRLLGQQAESLFGM